MEENTAIEHLATSQILHRGARMKMRAPLVWRLFGKQTISLTVKAPYEGTLQRVARYYLSTGLKETQLQDVSLEEALAIMAAHGKQLNKALACAWLNGYWSGKLFTKPLAWYMRWHCKPLELLTVLNLILVYGGTKDFMNTTRSVRMLKTTSLISGQKKAKGS